MTVVDLRRAGAWGVPVLLVVLLASAGCAPAFHPSFQSSGAPLDHASAERLARSTDIGPLAATETSRAPALRQQALAYLRSVGSVGGRAADLLTLGFPERTLSVPVLVRACRVDGRDAIVVVEAWGVSGGTLRWRRLWVFDRATGAIISAAAFR